MWYLIIAAADLEHRNRLRPPSYTQILQTSILYQPLSAQRMLLNSIYLVQLQADVFNVYIIPSYRIFIPL